MTINIALFKNGKKETENQPDWTGWNKETGDSVAGWNKTSARGDEYISLRFETKEDKQAQMANIKQQVNHIGQAAIHQAAAPGMIEKNTPPMPDDLDDNDPPF